MLTENSATKVYSLLKNVKVPNNVMKKKKLLVAEVISRDVKTSYDDLAN